MRILIVDDDLLVLCSLRRQLRGADRELETASCGAAAIEMLQSSQFDVIVSDLSMPDMDGLELLQHLRQKGLHVPFVLISGYESEDVSLPVDRGLSFLTKPISRDALLLAITRAIERHERERSEITRPIFAGTS